MVKHVTLYIALMSLLQMANPIPADKNSAEILKKLSPEVITAMEGNQKTINSMRTLEAVIKKTNEIGPVYISNIHGDHEVEFQCEEKAMNLLSISNVNLLYSQRHAI